MAIRPRATADIGKIDAKIAAVDMDIVELHTRDFVAPGTHIDIVPT